MDTLHKNMKIDELLILTTDEREKVSFGRYWGNKPDSTEKAHADMLEMWNQKKGNVVYLFRLEKIVKASDYPVTVGKPNEHISLFEVQTYTFLDDWFNCWSEEVNGESHPLTFKTYTAALEALTDFLAANHEACTNGAVEDQYDPHDYRIMEIR